MALRPLRLAIICAAATVALAYAVPAAAQQLLHNGSFEQGAASWNGPGLSTGDCPPRSGSAALAVPIFAQQNLPSPIGSGPYALSGAVKAQSGATSAELAFIWLDSKGSELTTTAKTVSAGTSYVTFSFTASSPAAAQSLRLRIEAQGGAICLDDLALDGPAPLPTATTPAQQSSSATPAATATASATPPPSPTPQPTATSRPTSTPSPSAGAAQFVNGGFEDGLTGWSNFGGILGLIDTPVHGGVHAARLASDTDSTKWAYQTVLVDAAKHYEFNGYVSAAGDVSHAYLRISWYASADGSGEAMSTSDSTSTIDGASGGYVYLTTGPVKPPDGASSARSRVVMVPSDAGPASILMDDLWFGDVAAPAEPSPQSGGQTGGQVTSQGSTSSRSGSPGRDGAPPAASAGHGRTPEVSATTAPSGPLATGPLELSADEDRGIPMIWLVGAALFVLLLGGGYWQGKRSQQAPRLFAQDGPTYTDSAD